MAALAFTLLDEVFKAGWGRTGLKALAFLGIGYLTLFNAACKAFLITRVLQIIRK